MSDARRSGQAGYYLVPRRLVHRTLFGLVALALLTVGAAWAFAPVWLAGIARVLDAEAPLRNPDVIVLRSAGQSREAERAAEQALRRGEVETIVVVGRPFSYDDLGPDGPNLRVRALAGLGVPRAGIVEVPEGRNLYEEMEALRDVATRRGWRRVAFYVDGMGAQRHLLVARRILGEAGIAVGQRAFHDGWLQEDNWWQDARGRSIVLYNLIELLVTLAAGRA